MKNDASIEVSLYEESGNGVSAADRILVQLPCNTNNKQSE